MMSLTNFDVIGIIENLVTAIKIKMTVIYWNYYLFYLNNKE
jgi:hypothetical protein